MKYYTSQTRKLPANLLLYSNDGEKQTTNTNSVVAAQHKTSCKNQVPTA